MIWNIFNVVGCFVGFFVFVVFYFFQNHGEKITIYTPASPSLTPSSLEYIFFWNKLKKFLS